jgi:hypothetical protein
VVTRFTILKLITLLLLFLAAGLIIITPATIVTPSLETPPAVILAGDLPLAGVGTPGSVVEVLGNNTLLGTSTVTDSGRWTYVASLSAEPHDLLVQAVTAEGNRLSGPEGRAQLLAVEPPTLDVADPGRWTATTKIELSGEGTPGSTLRLMWNEQAIITLEVGAAGQWQHLLPAAPVPSENDFLAQVLNDAGAVLGESAPRSLSLRAPAPLIIEQVDFSGFSRNAPSQLVSGELYMKGTGEPGAQIGLFRAETPVDRSTAVAGDGTWEVTTRLSLVPGEYMVATRMAAPDGRLLQEASATLAVPAPPTLRVSGGQTDIDEVFVTGTAQAHRALTLFANELPLATVTADGDGQWEYSTHLDAGSYLLHARSDRGLDSDSQELHVALARPVIIGQLQDEQGRTLPGFFGEARPDVQLEIIRDGVIIGQTAVDSAGRWQCHCKLAPGAHVVLVREVEEPERISDPLTIAIENLMPPFIPETAAPGAPPFRCPEPSPPGVLDGSIYTIGCGESLSGIAVRLNVTVEQLIAYNPQLANPPQVYFGQRLNVPAGAACADDETAITLTPANE